MEAWLAEKPIIVNEKSTVLKGHCEKSNGGLYYSNFDEFEGCVNYLLEHEEERKLMANNGKNYVLKNFGWKKIVEKYSNFINNLF